MTLLRRFVSVLGWLTRRTRAEQDLDDELQSFVAMAAARTDARRASPSEARRLAILPLGGIDQVKERVRAGRHGAWLDETARDSGRDDTSAPSIVAINEAMARLFFGGTNPIGRRLVRSVSGGEAAWLSHVMSGTAALASRGHRRRTCRTFNCQRCGQVGSWRARGFS